jgi:cold shock CspA family protein
LTASHTGTPGRGPIDGVVTSFDEPGGHGIVREEGSGTERWFHCTAIADGTRRIAADTRVTFVLAPGATGQWEAAALRPLAVAPAP